MSRLSLLAVSKRSVTLLLAGALFLAGISSWTSLKQELLPDIAFPVITVVAPYPGVGAADVTAQVAEPIERMPSGRSRYRPTACGARKRSARCRTSRSRASACPVS